MTADVTAPAAGTGTRTRGWPGPGAVVMAASTGGPRALERLVSGLPAAVPVPVLIVQHMPPPFPQLLAERLARTARLPVAVARDGERVVAGRVYVSPGGRHLAVGGTSSAPVVVLDDGPPENSCRPAADVLFRTAAPVWGPGLLAVVLTGMGRDGVSGCAQVRRYGGTVLVQDEASSVIWGMPRLVAEAGLADGVVSLDVMATQILARLRPAGHRGDTGD